MAPPYSRAAATAFTVFPNAEFAVIVDGLLRRFYAVSNR
jgi:hypothetical protein